MSLHTPQPHHEKSGFIFAQSLEIGGEGEADSGGQSSLLLEGWVWTCASLLIAGIGRLPHATY